MTPSPSRTASGNIWSLAHFLNDAIVIPINIGWKKDGHAVMGRGLARQAAVKFPRLTEECGDLCIRHRYELKPTQLRLIGASGVGSWLILFPTKPLNEQRPHMSWQGKADPELITRGLKHLAAMRPPKDPGGFIYVPLLGCGWGGLHRDVVWPLMQEHLTAPHFIFVKPR